MRRSSTISPIEWSPVSSRVLIGSALVMGLMLPTAVPALNANAAPASSSLDRSVSVPAGWSVRETANSTELSWRSTAPIPLADAAVEFWLGQRLLGTPKPEADGKTFTLVLDGRLPAAASNLRVTIGGVPVDASGDPRTIVRTGTPTDTPSAFKTPTAQRSGIDPGQPGRYATMTREYSLPGVQLTGLPRDVEMQGVVVRPTDAIGPRPLALFLHGRHSTCYRGGADGRSSGAWPCPENWQPIPSYRGYLDAQELLASQGYVTVSISANGINGQDYRVSDGGAQARSELVRHHLDALDRWNTIGGDPFGSALLGSIDLDRVMLVGHSRGGEGVNRAAVDTTSGDPWRIDSQVLIGPTAFGRQTAPGVDTAVLLPFCDGDVSDLQGQQYIDQARDLFGATRDPALRSAVMVMGANHNYFNLEWTPGPAVAPAWDDWGGRRGYCGKRADTRLAATEQRTVGAVYVASAARAFIKNDARALELLDGTNVRPASINDAAIEVAALGANRTPLVTFAPRTEMRTVNAFALVCRGYRVTKDQPTCAPGLSSYVQPHFLPMYGADDAPPSSALRMRWRQPGARVRVELPAPVDLTQSAALDLRVAVHPGSSPARFEVAVGDGSGHVANLGSATRSPLPGDGGLSKLWAQTVRFPLPEQGAMDFTDVRWIRFTGDSREGRVVVLDASGYAWGVSGAPRPTLPRVDVEDVSVKEGDSGEHVEEITLDVTGTVTGGERVYVESRNDRNDTVTRVVRLRPGQTTVAVPFTVTGDTRDDYRRRSRVTVKAISGLITGDYSGTIAILDDDPPPKVLIDEPTDVVTEGDGALTWSLRLDHRSDKSVWWRVRPVDAGDNEMTVSDLPDQFRRRYDLGSYPDDTKLSDTRLRLFTDVRPRRLRAEFMLPIKADGIAEYAETVILREMGSNQLPLPSKLFGTVNDAAS